MKRDEDRGWLDDGVDGEKIRAYHSTKGGFVVGFHGKSRACLSYYAGMIAGRAG